MVGPLFEGGDQLTSNSRYPDVRVGADGWPGTSGTSTTYVTSVTVIITPMEERPPWASATSTMNEYEPAVS